MNTSSIKLYTLNYNELKTYIVTLLFIAGNIILPQLCHLIPQGGIIWLPIYFFTLVGAYKYGWKAGLMIGIFSPIVNSLLFGMPAAAVLPSILFKSTLLAIAAGWAASHFKRVSIPILLLVILAYQTIGTLGEWLLINIDDSFYQAAQDFRIGLPGMCVQIFGGYLFIKHLIYK